MTEKYTQLKGKYTKLKFRAVRTKAYAVALDIEAEDGATIADGQQAILMRIAGIPEDRWTSVPEEKITVTLMEAEPVKEEE